MGRHLKALVMTLLIMEITAIVALTTVWTLLSELHAPQNLIRIAAGLAVVGLAVLTVVVYRRALRAEHRLAAELEATDGDDAPLPEPQALLPVNAVAPGLPRPLLPPRGSGSSRHAR